MENGAFWDDDVDEIGKRPRDLYGDHNWRIENFSAITEARLVSELFRVGGSEWRIVIYRGRDHMEDYISLYLRAEHRVGDEILDGCYNWVQFTLKVENTDPKKSKYLDLIHKFCAKDTHGRGIRKFISLEDLQDGFLNGDTLEIKAQVQVLRNEGYLSRCLHRSYGLEMATVYLTSIEEAHRIFVERIRSQLGRLVNRPRIWCSFQRFYKSWIKRRQNWFRVHNLLIQSYILKHFFHKSRVNSTLIVDSLYNGLRCMKSPSTKENSLLVNLVVIDDDEFLVLADDFITLIKRIASKPLHANDNKGGASVENCEGRLTEIGCELLEYFAFYFIYGKFEIEFQKEEGPVALTLEELDNEDEKTEGKKQNRKKKAQKGCSSSSNDNSGSTGQKASEKRTDLDAEVSKPASDRENFNLDSNNEIKEKSEDDSGEILVNLTTGSDLATKNQITGAEAVPAGDETLEEEKKDQEDDSINQEISHSGSQNQITELIVMESNSNSNSEQADFITDRDFNNSDMESIKKELYDLRREIVSLKEEKERQDWGRVAQLNELWRQIVCLKEEKERLDWGRLAQLNELWRQIISLKEEKEKLERGREIQVEGLEREILSLKEENVKLESERYLLSMENLMFSAELRDLKYQRIQHRF